MDQEAFNLSIRKFLKTVGVGSQHEIERAVHAALREGALPAETRLPAKVTLEIPSLGLQVPFDGEIKLR
jgi:hypothetical protein